MPNDPIQQAKDALDRAIETERRNKRFIESIGPAIVNSLVPILKDVLQQTKVVINPKVDIPPLEQPVINVKAPDVVYPEINIPQIKVPKIPAPKVTVKVPKNDGTKDIIKGLQNLEKAVSSQSITFPDQIEYTTQKPMPIEIISDRVGLNQGGKTAYLRGKAGNVASVRDFTSSISAVDMAIVDSDGNQITSFGGGTQYTEGDTDSSLTGTVFMFEGNDDNPLPVSSTVPLPIEIITDSAGIGGGVQYEEGDIDNEFTGTMILYGGANSTATMPTHTAPLPVSLSRVASDFEASVNVSGFTGSLGATLLDGDGNYRDTMPVEGSVAVTGITGSVGAYQLDGDGNYRGTFPVEGTVDVTTVTDITNSVAAYQLDADGNYRDVLPISADSLPLPSGAATAANQQTDALTDTELRASGVPVHQVSGFAWSVVVNSFDTSISAVLANSESLEYDSDNPLPVTLATKLDKDNDSITTYMAADSVSSVIVNGFLSSVVTEGTAVSDASDDGSAPHKMGGIARTANPTAVSGGDRVSATFDDLGRQVMTPIQVRDLRSTAYVTLTDSSEDTLFAGAASTFHDLVYVMGANASDAAVSIDIRCGTGGSKATTLTIPAESTTGFILPMPYPASEVAQTWTAQNSGSDISNTTVNITAEFSKEV